VNGSESLSEDEKAEARQIFAGAGTEDSRICSFCGGFHMRACPRVAEFELYEGNPTRPGGLKRVRFWAEGEWNDSFIVWPEDLGDEVSADE
jgi:hypothetical protein